MWNVKDSCKLILIELIKSTMKVFMSLTLIDYDERDITDLFLSAFHMYNIKIIWILHDVDWKYHNDVQ